MLFLQYTVLCVMNCLWHSYVKSIELLKHVWDDIDLRHLKQIYSVMSFNIHLYALLYYLK